MLGWIHRGLSGGRLTTRYPQTPERPPDGFHGPLLVLNAADADRELEWCCPTGAITVDRHRRLTVDRGRCIQCGDCIRRAPHRFAFAQRYETATRRRSAMTIGAAGGQPDEPDRPSLAQRSAPLRRSVHVRHVDSGSDGAEEWEIQALWNPRYDIQRLGFFLTAAPRHADILLATGVVTPSLRPMLARVWEAMPAPKAAVAVGTDACSGGLSAQDGAAYSGTDAVLPVDVYVPGSPPAPIAILEGLLLAAGMIGARR